MPDQRFLSADGEPADRLEAEARAFSIPPDAFNGCRFLLALIDEDAAELEKIVTENPAVPLLSGIASLALTLGENAAGGDQAKLRQMLDVLALSPVVDAAGTADTYRARRTS